MGHEGVISNSLGLPENKWSNYSSFISWLDRISDCMVIGLMGCWAKHGPIIAHYRMAIPWNAGDENVVLGADPLRHVQQTSVTASWTMPFPAWNPRQCSHYLSRIMPLWPWEKINLIHVWILRPLCLGRGEWLFPIFSWYWKYLVAVCIKNINIKLGHLSKLLMVGALYSIWKCYRKLRLSLSTSPSEILLGWVTFSIG